MKPNCAVGFLMLIFLMVVIIFVIMATGNQKTGVRVHTPKTIPRKPIIENGTESLEPRFAEFGAELVQGGWIGIKNATNVIMAILPNMQYDGNDLNTLIYLLFGALYIVGCLGCGFVFLKWICPEPSPDFDDIELDDLELGEGMFDISPVTYPSMSTDNVFVIDETIQQRY